MDATEAVEKIEALDDERKSIQAQLDACLAQQNAIAKEVGMLFKQGKKEEAEAAKAKTVQLKERSRSMEERLRAVGEEPERRDRDVAEFPEQGRAARQDGGR